MVKRGAKKNSLVFLAISCSFFVKNLVGGLFSRHGKKLISFKIESFSSNPAKIIKCLYRKSAFIFFKASGSNRSKTKVKVYFLNQKLWSDPRPPYLHIL